jgi:hypothetical protein
VANPLPYWGREYITAVKKLFYRTLINDIEKSRRAARLASALKLQKRGRFQNDYHLNETLQDDIQLYGTHQNVIQLNEYQHNEI